MAMATLLVGPRRGPQNPPASVAERSGASVEGRGAGATRAAGERRARPPISSLQAVEPHRATGQDAALGGFREGRAPGDHGGGTREEPVGVRVVRGPQDLVRSDVIGEDVEGPFDRLEGDPAVALEQLAWVGGEARVVEVLIIEEAGHAVDPRVCSVCTG